MHHLPLSAAEGNGAQGRSDVCGVTQRTHRSLRSQSLDAVWAFVGWWIEKLELGGLPLTHPTSFYQIINWIFWLNLEEEPALSELRIFVPSDYAANNNNKKICISLLVNVFVSWFWITCVPAETKVQVLGEKCFFRSIVQFQFIYGGIFQTVNSLNMV